MKATQIKSSRWVMAVTITPLKFAGRPDGRGRKSMARPFGWPLFLFFLFWGRFTVGRHQGGPSDFPPSRRSGLGNGRDEWSADR